MTNILMNTVYASIQAVPKDACELECCEGIYCHDHILKALNERQQCPTCGHARKVEDISPAFFIRRKINNLLARCVSCKEEDIWDVLTRTHKLCAAEIALLKPEKRRIMYPYKNIERDSDVLMCAESGSWALCVSETGKTLTVYTVPRSYLFDPKPPAVPSTPPNTIDASMWMQSGLNRGVDNRDTLVACIVSAVPEAFKNEPHDTSQSKHPPSAVVQDTLPRPVGQQIVANPLSSSTAEHTQSAPANIVDLTMVEDNPPTPPAQAKATPRDSSMMKGDHADSRQGSSTNGTGLAMPNADSPDPLLPDSPYPWEDAVMDLIGELQPIPNAPTRISKYDPGRGREHCIPRHLTQMILKLPLTYESCIWLGEQGIKFLDAVVYLETAFTLFYYANDLHVKITDVAMPSALYNMACCLSRLSSNVAAREHVRCATRAVSWLWAAVGAGFSDANTLRDNPDLAWVRERYPASIDQILASASSNKSQPHARFIRKLVNRGKADYSVFSKVTPEEYGTTAERGSAVGITAPVSGVGPSKRSRSGSGNVSDPSDASDWWSDSRSRRRRRRNPPDIGVFENPESIERGVLGQFSNVLHSEPIGGSPPQTTTQENGLCLDIGSAADSRAIVNHYWREPNHNCKFQHLPAPVLSARQCAVLVNHIETSYTETESSAGVSASATDEDSRIDPSATRDDFKLTLSVAELTALLDEHTVEALGLLVGHQYSEIKLRRVQASGQCIQFHLDHSRLTLQVLLNHNGVDYTGGNLVYATQEGFRLPVRAPGSATVHDNNIPHGVTQMRDGVRYSLFFLDI